MKSLSLILNVVLIVAVGILYYFHFNTTEPVDSNEKKTASEEVLQGDLRIAYINADTVLKNYDFFKAKQKELEGRQKEMDQDFTARAQGLQTEVTNYQKTMQNLTMGQARALEEDLMKKQQNLRMYQETLTQELLKEEAKINEELYSKVTEYIEDYSKNNNIEVVVKFNPGSDILYAGKGMDITSEIISGLNAKYQEEKASSTSKE